MGTLFSLANICQTPPWRTWSCCGDSEHWARVLAPSHPSLGRITSAGWKKPRLPLVSPSRASGLLGDATCRSTLTQCPLPGPDFSGHSPELAKALLTGRIPDAQADEDALAQQFERPNPRKRWREGTVKSSFTYLLLDPR
jgi:hypothetical protein